MRIQTSRTETMVTRDGAGQQHESIVTVTETSCYDLERIDDFDDLYQCGLARAQRLGQMEAFTERFNAETCCDAREQAMIHALKDFLRPQQAPANLLGRVMQCLDRICDEEELETPATAQIAGFEASGFSGLPAQAVNASDGGEYTHPSVGFVSGRE